MPHRIFEKRHAAPGTAPGTLRAPEQRVERVRIRVIRYSPEEIEEVEVPGVDECAAFRPAAGGAASGGATWIDVVGLHDADLVARLGECFGLHSLALEDALNTGQRPKADDYDDHLYCVLRNFHAENANLVSEQISLFLMPGLLLTFQEMEGDVFEPVRERLRQRQGRASADGRGLPRLRPARRPRGPVLRGDRGAQGEQHRGARGRAVLARPDARSTLQKRLRALRRDAAACCAARPGRCARCSAPCSARTPALIEDRTRSSRTSATPTTTPCR
jgi:hypothetical protein